MDSLSDARTASEADLARLILGAGPGSAREAEAELFRRLAPRVRLYGLRHLREEQAAADLVQQVMILTIEQLRACKVREPDKIGAFVLGICRLAVMELRRGHTRRERLLQRYAQDLPLADPSVAPRLDQDRLAACIERLSARERTVLLMTFYEEKSAQAVGAALGLTPANVRVIRHRGLAHLRDCVSGGEELP
ncbi:sigma-70 family RNA polymerase sigma factor [Reyranella sp.]|uniref:RNA polymerase sigma factor n=1 Tax=Reyranella sp. TaxID=1929291 RepID=UPI002F95B731